MTNNRSKDKRNHNSPVTWKKNSPPWIHLTSARAERCCVAVVQNCVLRGSSHILYSTVSSKHHKNTLSFSSKSHRRLLFWHYVWPATSHTRPSSCPVTAVSLTPLQVQAWLKAESNQTGSPSQKGQEAIPPFFFFWEVSVYMQRDQYKTNQSPP